MNLSDFMVAEAMIPDLKGQTRDDVIRELVNALAAAKKVSAKDAEEITAKIIEREKQGSTGIGKGIAVPHIKHPNIKQIVGTIGCSKAGINFSSLDKAPVFSVLLLLSPPNNPDKHLEAMESLFAHLQRDLFRKFLRQVTTKEEIMDLIKEADDSHLQNRI